MDPENPTNQPTEEEEEGELKQCSNCGDIGQIGHMCERCKGAIYENEIDPEAILNDEEEEEEEDESEEEEFKKTTMLPTMNALQKERKERLEMTQASGWSFGWCKQCKMVGRLHTCCMKCAAMGITSNHTKPAETEREEADGGSTK